GMGSGEAVAAPSPSNTPSVTAVRTTFSRNHASLYGGGFVGSSTDAVFDACTFALNTAFRGGGIHHLGGHLDVQNSTLFQNEVEDSGGGIYLAGVITGLYNVTLAGNGVDSDLDGTGSGGGLYVSNSSVYVWNSVFANVNDNTHENDDCHTAGSLIITFAGGNVVRSTNGCAYTTQY